MAALKVRISLSMLARTGVWAVDRCPEFVIGAWHGLFLTGVKRHWGVHGVQQCPQIIFLDHVGAPSARHLERGQLARLNPGHDGSLVALGDFGCLSGAQEVTWHIITPFLCCVILSHEVSLSDQ